MSISIQKSNQLKSIAILMMLFLHLFNQDYLNVFKPIIFIGMKPLSYYLSLFCDACVPIFSFVSGYGLYYTYQKNKIIYRYNNLKKLKKLYINYWIILLLFAVIIGSLLKLEGYPGTINKLILNLSAIDPTYNGAWWFLTIYILFVLSSAFWFSLLEKTNPYFLFLFFLILYLIAFYFRIYKTNIFENNLLEYIHRYAALYFCTLFQFMLGSFACKFEWNNKVDFILEKIKYKNIISITCIGLLIFFHSIFPNFIIAPFTGVGFIFLFLQINISKVGNKILDYFTPHTTNIWLIHLFFSMIYFSKLIYSFQYVPAIFLVLIILSLFSSYIVNYINRKIS
ncbi:acyltransferase family protein [Epilithonimonas zeae]|uniref:acyltransferase family protein n=1 Tax=Epilithonimonas zeae TaxID=1416779 RepID=UPI00200CADB1|nr:acyltransferase family protein [Epilithonimonas zeae]UQB67450.1 acyltransferase family protein [Epilithonimonas zeae]